VLREMRAAKEMRARGSTEFDDAFTSASATHLSNGVRTFVHGLTVPARRCRAAPLKRHYYRFCAWRHSLFADVDAAMGARSSARKNLRRLGDAVDVALISATLRTTRTRTHQEDLP
jgi:hypothetical protein